MKARKYYLFLSIGVAVLAIVILFPKGRASASGGGGQLIAASSMLSGLAPGAAFPIPPATAMPAPLLLTISRSW